MKEKIRGRIIRALQRAEPIGLTISEVAHRAKVTRITASNYLQTLADQGEVVVVLKPPLKLHLLAEGAQVSYQPEEGV